MTLEIMPPDDWLGRKVGRAQLEGIVVRLRPLAALRVSSWQVVSLIAQGKGASSPESAGLLELAAWDPAIAANVLAAARQGAAGGDSSAAPTSVSGALRSLGEETTWTIVLASLGRRWPGEAGDWDRREFWRHSVAAALAAGLIARHAALPLDADEARTCGLLHDLGKLGMRQVMPKACLRVDDSLAAEGGGDLAAREQAMLGVDHALFGRRMAQQWRFDEALADAMWLHHLPPDSRASRPEARLRAGVAQLADALARELEIGFAGNSADARLSELAQQMGVEARALALAREELPGECHRLFERLGLENDDPPAATDDSRLAQASIERLASAGRQWHAETSAIKGRAAAMDSLARFLEARRPGEPLHEVLAAIVRLAREALGPALPPAPAVVAYALDGAEPELPAACLRGGAEPDFVMLVRADDLPGDSASPAPRLMLEDSAALRRWLDPAAAAHIPLCSGGRQVGGVLVGECGGAGADFAADHVAPLAAAAAHWLAMCMELRRSANQAERLAETCQALAANQESLARAKALAAVGEMGASAAHEINNPLAIISGRAQLMLGRAAGEEEKKVWRLIVEESQRISDIITSLVEIAHPPHPRLAAVAAGDLLSESAAAYRAAGGADLKSAPMRVDIQTAGNLPLVRADRGQMAGVLAELLTNAAAAGARSAVLAAAAGPRGGVVLRVADDGPGLDAETLSAAFTPLFSRQPAGRRKGLGLSRARATLEAHGGSIWIRSRPGRGATVFVQLPAADT
jgi:putative nucleotidyltransferase with HDIG domain